MRTLETSLLWNIIAHAPSTEGDLVLFRDEPVEVELRSIRVLCCLEYRRPLRPDNTITKVTLGQLLEHPGTAVRESVFQW